MNSAAKILVHATANNEVNICWEMLNEATGKVIGQIRKTKATGTYLGKEIGYVTAVTGRNHADIARQIAASYRARNAR
jgi:hypothetical protein